MYEYYLPFIGKKSERLYHRVSADSIRAFAQAIGEENPVYYDEEYAKTTKYGRMIAPPTYCLSLKTADIPGLWIAPVGRIHAGQRFIWNRPIFADEIVSIEQVITNTFEKTGKKGQMIFLEQTKNVYDADENLICSFIVTTITMDKLFPKDLDKLSVASAESAAAKWQARPSPKMAVGMTFPEVQLPPVKRMDFVYYAGASGDFNTIHVIDSEAQKVGYPQVIAQGMFTAALQGRVAEAWIGDGYRLKDYSLRLAGPVFPDDVLKFNGTVTEVDEASGAIKVEYKVENMRDQLVMNGSFEAVVC